MRCLVGETESWRGRASGIIGRTRRGPWRLSRHGRLRGEIAPRCNPTSQKRDVGHPGTEANNGRWKMVIFCMILMAVCLAVEGILLLFSGFPLPGQPTLLYVVGGIWALTFFSMFIFRRQPSLTTALGCLLFAVNAYDLWFHSNEEKSLPWFLYQHSVEIAFIGLSCLGLVLIQRRKRSQSTPTMHV
jgi:hypothetical protein